MSYWRGKRAVITGGSAGLGRVLAGALVERGARVAIVGRDPTKLDGTSRELNGNGEGVLAIAADVTKQEDVDRLQATLHEAWGGVDFVCHCAGRSMRGNVITTPIEEFHAMWETNFLAAVRLTQAFSDSLIQNRGHVVLIGSLASKVAPRFLGAYPTSKFPLAAFAQQLRLELGPSGVHTLLVCPGPIAREDAGARYSGKDSAVPSEARKPGGGAKVKAIDPRKLSEQILRACEKRQVELIVPKRARLLFVLSQLSPRLGDWLLRKTTSG